MKITEIIFEYVGDVGPETMILHPPEPSEQNQRKDDQIPQVGYKMRIGKKLIPTARYNSANDQGQSNQVIGG